MTEPERTRVDPEVPADAVICRSCDAPLADDQRYCLRCGDAVEGVAPGLPSGASAASAPAPAATVARVPAGRRILSSDRVLPGALAAGLALLVTGALFGAAIAGDELRQAPISIRVPAAKPPVVNIAAPLASSSEQPFVSGWGTRSGWTVQLQAIPKQGSTPAALEAAKSAATAQGAPGVGALDSDEHPSLDAGSYVIYSKYYPTKRQATAAARRLRADFPGARVVQVKVTGADAKTSDRKLDELESSSGDDFVKKSKKLPDKVESEGPAPPKDDKPAGAGGDAETIG